MKIAIVIYLIAINAAGFFTFGYDKLMAKKRERRVPEKRLFGIAALGGAAGAWIGMRAFRHKTKHASFTIGIPALLALNAVCIGLFIKWFV
ncbi:DUF1294 domain-containing protein [Paenibacillus ginsengarvi]|uniref:DUF1294 domain-containing protein n=1 Tax=Paenibacillus ginsengarvi TaxID=400777 RepID=A0A3B0C3S2_9BACL|nr:DUF1294 domain-containing protein [Paenibacillus ginsengarvi]RKN79191.1 DUF1294 domain-containing protein [Paenibacillus ginsengarvi]